MASDPQHVIPMIAYENGGAAMDWLARAFGFEEKTRMLAADGRLLTARWRPAAKERMAE